MTDPVIQSLDRNLADIDADDARTEAVQALAQAIQGDIDVILEGNTSRDGAALLNGKACIDKAIEDFDVDGNSVHALLVAIGAGDDTTAAVEAVRRDLKALAYEAATVRADRIIDEGQA